MTDQELIERLAVEKRDRRAYWKEYWKAYYERNKPRILARHERQRKTEQGRAVAYRKARAWAARNPEKRRAYEKVKDALRRGDLVKKPCEDCGNPKVEAHHDSYVRSQWLVVRWLCPVHHKAWHLTNVPFVPILSPKE